MASVSKTRPILLAAGLIAAIGLVWWLLPAASRESGSLATPSHNETQITEPVRQAGLKQAPAAERRVAKRRSLPPAGSRQLPMGEELLTPPVVAGAAFRAEDYSKTRMQIYYEFQRAVRSWTPEIFNQKTQQRETLTGEQIYEAYVYLRSCLDSLRSVAGYQQRAQAMERHHQRNPDDFPLAEIQQALDRYRSDLVRCEGVGKNQANGLEPLLVDWLSLSAERGYPQAQIAYHQSIRWLLTRQAMTVYRDPRAVRQYRDLAPSYLQAAVRSGHSEAFAEYSLAMQEGILFKQDFELAFAYARAGDLAAHGNNDTATTYLAIMENVLEPSQIAAGRKRGRELCDQWC